MNKYDKYEAVIGLEVHIQLLTNSKAYCNDTNAYGEAPNTLIGPVTLALPGTLPVANTKVIEHAVKLGVACESTITPYNEYARKNYFYADLPKGYQITQDKTPICTGGYIKIKSENKEEKKIRLTRIHMEEDAGKSIHDQDPFHSLIDLNRAGVPLLEMVSEPDIANAEEAYKYLYEVRKLVRYLGVCDGNMEEGSLRCDANISVRIKGEKKFGKKVEVKNMNSMRNVQKAIEFEIIRQIDEIEAGNTIAQETRSFDAAKGTTFSMRTKEMANDYRYFPEPDLQPVLIKQEYINAIKNELPLLPSQLLNKYMQEYKLPEYDALQLTEEKSLSEYFEKLTEHTKNYKAASNWLMGSVKNYLNENGIHINEFTLNPEQIAAIIALIDSGKISNTVAAQHIFPALIESPHKSPLQIAEEKNLIQESNSGLIEQLALEVINKFPEKVAEYKNGKTGLIGMFMGEVMKLSKGKADPKAANKIVKELLDKQ